MENKFSGKLLKQIRIENNLTQEQLAKNVGVSGANISRWEAGIQEPSLNCYIRLSDYFGVSLNYFIGREDY